MLVKDGPIHFVLPVVGSKGDLFPLLAVGEELRSRGHQVTVVAPIIYSGAALASGVEFIGLSSEDEHRRSSMDRRLLNTRYQGLFYLRHAVAWNLAIYQVVQRNAYDRLMVLAVDRPNLWADLVAHAHLRTPVVRFQIDLPVCPESVRAHAALPPGRVLRELSSRWQMEWSRRAKGLGLHSRLSTVPRMMRSIRSRVPTISLYPAWLTGGAGTIPGAPALGFVRPQRFDTLPEHSSSQHAVVRDLLVFVVGTDGVVAGWAEEFCKTSIAICEALGYSGILLGGDCEGGSHQGLPPSVKWRSFVPFGEILPRAAAIIHHGGIGTAAAAIEHGVPQLIVPRMFAQPINAEWLRRLGLCIVMEPWNYTARGGAESIAALLHDPKFRTRAMHYAPRCYVKEDVQRLGKRLEEWMAQSER